MISDGTPDSQHPYRHFAGGQPDIPCKILSQSSGLSMQSQSELPTQKYHVALSFAGEDRKYVERVAAQLAAAGVSVFYDKFEEATLWGKNLYTHLRDVYENKASFTVMFISEHY